MPAADGAATEAPATPTRRSLRADVLLMLGNRGAHLFFTAAMSVVLARALGPSGRGEVAVGISLTLVFVQLGSLGIVAANPYFAAREPDAIPAIITNAVWMALGLGALLAGLGAALKATFPDAIGGIDGAELVVVLVAIPAALGAQFLQSVLLGEGRTVSYNAIEVLFGALAFVTLLVGFVAFDMGPLGALAILSLQWVCSALVFLGLGLRHAPRLARPDVALMRRMLRYGFKVYVATLVAFLVIRVDLLMVNGYLGEREAGLYSVAVAIADALYLLPAVVATNLFPRVARGGSSGATAEVFRIVAVLYALLCLASVALAEPAIRLLMGPEFAGAAALYYWLAPGIYCLGMLNILAYHFAGRGYPVEAVLVWFVGFGVNLAINIALLHNGTYVASLASSVAYLILLVLHLRLFAKETGGYRELVPGPSDFVAFTRIVVGSRRS